MRPGLAGALLAISALGAAAEERVADIRQGTNLSAALAPDGSTLVVDVLGQLWTMPAAGGGAVPLTTAGEHARNPRFSPDGKRVVYQRRNGEQWDLWLLELATREQRPLATTTFDEREPDFTPGRPRGGLRDEPHRALLPLVDHARRRCGDAAHGRKRQRRIPRRWPSTAASPICLKRDGEWSIRVLGADGVISIAHSSTRPFVALRLGDPAAAYWCSASRTPQKRAGCRCSSSASRAC